MIEVHNKGDSEIQVSSDRKPERKFRYLIFTFSIMVILLLSLETISYVALKFKGYSPGFLILIDPKNDQILQRIHRNADIELDSIDPHLGYALNLRILETRINKKTIRLIPGFVQYYNPDKDTSKAIKIVTLGGSTTQDGMGDWSWPEYLFEILDQKGFNVIVYNGAVAGYYSSQEMFKLIRDALPLHPNLIISYSGINDLGYLGSHTKHPHVHPYQSALCRYLATGGELSFPLFPSTFMVGHKVLKKFFKAGKYINYGTPLGCTPSEHWFTNINIMHAVSKQFNINYLAILQPTLGIGNYHLTKEETEYLQLYLKKRPKWLERAGSFYVDARKKCNEVEFCIDFEDVFTSQGPFYKDATHQNNEGKYFLAQAIKTQLVKRDLINRG